MLTLKRNNTHSEPVKTRISVKAYAGRKAEESPRSFTRDEHEHWISEIKRTWLTEDFISREKIIHFVVVADQQTFHLMYYPKVEAWYLSDTI